MLTIRRVLGIILIGLSGAGILAAGWFGLNFQSPGISISFDEANQFHQSVYRDDDLEKLLEQNLRMQEAIFSAQKQGIEATLQQLHQLQANGQKNVTLLVFLVSGSAFCFLLAFLLVPRTVRIHKDSLGQMETIIWQHMVVDQGTDMKDQYAVKESAYAVHLCGCSDSGVPVSLCGCNQSALPVHLCKCGCW